MLSNQCDSNFIESQIHRLLTNLTSVHEEHLWFSRETWAFGVAEELDKIKYLDSDAVASVDLAEISVGEDAADESIGLLVVLLAVRQQCVLHLLDRQVAVDVYVKSQIAE